MIKYTSIPGVKVLKSHKDLISHLKSELEAFHLKTMKKIKSKRKLK